MSTEGLPVNNVVGTSVDLGARSVQDAANSASSSQNADSAAASADAAWKFSRIAQGAAGDSATAVSDAEAAAVAAIAAAQNATITSNLYPSLDGDLGANAAIAAGLIPNGALFNVSVPALSTPQRLADEYLNVDGVATLTGQTIASGKMVDGLSITSGDLLPTANPRAAAINGASIISLPDNRSVGFSIPAGSTGATSYISGDVPLSDMRGKRIKMVQFLTATSNWLTDTPRSAVVAQVRVGNAVATITPISSAIVQYGTMITQTVIFDVPVDADYCGLNIQVNSNPGTKGYSRDIKISHIHYELVTLNVGQTQNDAMLDVRLAPLAAGVNYATATADKALLTSGNVYGSASTTAGAGGVSNGASFILDPAGNRIGFDIPASTGGTTTGGGGSYITAWFSANGLANKTVTITTTYNASTGFLSGTTYSGVALQVRRAGVISTGTVISRALAQNGTVLTQTTVYQVSELDTDIGATFQISAGHASRNYDRNLSISRVSYVIYPVAGQTQNDTMLSAYVASKISNISRGYSIFKTVKPVGGDFSHPKLAIDSISDASVSKRYCIAVYPGEYGGYAEWSTKNYVDIIGIGRREEIIISYDSGDSADQNTVRNTSLFWMASETLIKNLTLKIKNGRYCIHMEGNGVATGVTMAIEDCTVIHEGNASNTYWWQPSQYGVGSGLSAGNTVRLRNSYFEGPGGGFSFHTPNNRVAYTMPITVDVEGCTFKNSRTLPNAGFPYEGAFWIKPITKGAADTCRLAGNTFVNGEVYYSTGEWLDEDDTTTNRAQVELWGHGNAGFSFYSNEPYTPNMTGINQ